MLLHPGEGVASQARQQVVAGGFFGAHVAHEAYVVIGRAVCRVGPVFYEWGPGKIFDTDRSRGRYHNIATEHARKHRLGVVGVAAHEVAHAVDARHGAAAVCPRYLLEALNDMGMAADDQVDPGIGAGLGHLALPVVGDACVFLAAVHVHHHSVGRRAGASVVLCERGAVPRHGVIVIGQICLVIAVLAVRIREEGDLGTLALHHAHLRAVLLVGVAADEGDVRVALPQLLHVFDGARPVVVGVVGVGAHHVKARIYQRLRHGVGRVVAGVAAPVPVGVSAQDRLLVDEGDVKAAHDGRNLAVQGREVVHAVARSSAAPHLGNLQGALVGEVVAHGAERDAGVPRVCRRVACARCRDVAGNRGGNEMGGIRARVFRPACGAGKAQRSHGSGSQVRRERAAREPLLAACAILGEGRTATLELKTRAGVCVGMLRGVVHDGPSGLGFSHSLILTFSRQGLSRDGPMALPV